MAAVNSGVEVKSHVAVKLRKAKRDDENALKIQQAEEVAEIARVTEEAAKKAKENMSAERAPPEEPRIFKLESAFVKSNLKQVTRINALNSLEEASVWSTPFLLSDCNEVKMFSAQNNVFNNIVKWGKSHTSMDTYRQIRDASSRPRRRRGLRS